ncbi:MAG: GNAT family N-acetyltransferase [Lutimonas sp.]
MKCSLPVDDFRNFETERLLLRPTGLEDATLVLELLNTPKWLKFIGDRNVKTLEEAQEYIKSRMIPQLKRLGYSNYTIVKKSDGTPIGTCGLYDREGLEGIDIGFALLPQFEGQGYGFEAAARIKSAAFEDFGIDQLQGITSPENIASQALLRKLGFNLAGTTRLPNQKEDLFLFKT